MINANGHKIDPQVYVDKWVNWALHEPCVKSYEEIEDAIDFVYGKAGLDKPKVVVCRNLEEFGEIIGSIRNSVRDLVGDLVWNFFRNLVRESAWNSVRDFVWNSVRDSVRSSVRDSVRDFVCNSVWNSVRDFVWDYNSPLYLAEYLAFADMFSDANLLKKEVQKELTNWKKHAKGISFCAYGKSTCVVLVEPAYELNNDGNLHSEDDFAVKWSDTSGFYFLHGVRFEKKLWQNVIDGMDFKEVMEIENMEQRMAVLKMLDADTLLEGAGAKKLDDSKRGNELYLIENMFPQFEKAYFLRYECPSTGRVYLSGIDPKIAESEDADACMAWKHHLSKPAYQALTNES